MMINLTVDQVVTYDKNPRREINSEYQQIKASIQKRGMDQVLSVTQRPSDQMDQFMIVHGGNTRLQILKELYAETQDFKFQSLQCRYVTWKSESDALIGHLIENDARGDYNFIDRAIGIINAKQELEKESKEILSSRKLITALKSQGYKLSRADWFRMSYAVNVLYPIIPKALDNNLGPWQIDAIKKLDKYALGLFLELKGNNATPEDWKENYKIALLKHNLTDFSYDALLEDVLLVLANNDSAEANRLSFILLGQLEGLEKQAGGSGSTLNLEEKNRISPENNTTSQFEATPPTKKKDSNTQSPDSHSMFSNSEGSKNPDLSDKDSHQKNLKVKKSVVNNDFTPSIEAFKGANLSPRQLRDEIFSVALKLASDNGFGGLVTPLPSVGVGFLLKDLPSKSFMEGEKLFGIINKRPYKERIMVWWMLFGFSELRAMSINNPNAIAPLLPETDLKRALFNSGRNDQDKCNMALDRIFRRTGEFIIDDLVVYFWAVASKSNMERMMELQQLYRQLNEVLEFNLWEIKT